MFVSQRKRTSQVAPVVKNASANVGDIEARTGSLLWGRSSGGHWQPTPVFLPGKPQGQRSLAGYSP